MAITSAASMSLLARGAAAQDYAELDVLGVYACPDTVVESVSELADAKQSLATVRDVRTGLRRTLRRGGSFAQYRVAHIGHNPRLGAPSVWLWSRDGLCQQTLRGTAPSPPPVDSNSTPNSEPGSKRSTKRNATTPTAQRTASEVPPLAERVNIVEGPDGQRQVTRDALNDVLEHLPELQRDARVSPVREGRRQTAWRLVLKKDSLLERLGLQDGDALKAVNGNDISTPEGALRSYAQVRMEPYLKIQLERDGQPVTLVVRIKEDE